MSDPSLNQSAAPSKPTPESMLTDALSRADNFQLFTGDDARRIEADLAELLELRRERAGGTVFKRAGSSKWQLRYRVGDRWIDESSGTTDKREAQRWLAWKVYQASTGALPGTAKIDQAIELLLNDARVRGLRAVERVERATRPLLARLSGMRAKDVSHSVLVKYASDRKNDGRTPDSIKFELDVARQALKMAQREGWITGLPEFPRIEHLHVRSGFFDAHEWAEVRKHLRPDFRDAADFAFLTGWREMEVLALKWSHVDERAGVVKLDLGSTKSGAGRVLPFADYPQVVEVIERRRVVAKRLAAAAAISPWVFCFAEPLQVRGRTYRAAGAPLFRPDRDRGLPTILRAEWSAACRAAGLPGLMFHDLRRSAARNFERAGIPRSVARRLGGWSDKIYSRYAIGAESELSGAVGKVADYVTRAGWQSRGSRSKASMKSRELVAEGGGSRTLRQQY
ncbi:MAG: tyrosine-type recombinase/integrase [Candidatus Binatus sp.]